MCWRFGGVLSHFILQEVEVVLRPREAPMYQDLHKIWPPRCKAAELIKSKKIDRCWYLTEALSSGAHSPCPFILTDHGEEKEALIESS